MGWSFLCAFAPLREIFFASIVVSVASLLDGQTRAGEGKVSEADQQMQAKLQAIADCVGGSFGLVVEDLAGEHRFAVNAERQFTQASCIKTPILLEVLKQAHEGKLRLSDRHWVERSNKTSGSGILQELGDCTVELSVEDLCVLMIVLSDNTATNMLIDQIGMENVTATMAELGAPQTVLRRRMMDTTAAARGEENLSTPADAARILRLLHEGKFVSREVSDHALAILRKPKAGAIRSTVPLSVPVPFKPGELPGLLTEWALVELPERPYIVVVMGTYNPKTSTDDDLDAAMKQVGKEAYKFFKGLK
jgi:beta-lactamase class A